ncbi:MAG: molybdopterin-dependent oxidoreductase [Candidatus Eiseniibacteriota bacterium]
MSDGTIEQAPPLKRRDFLKLVGVTTAATAGAGCIEFPPPPENVLPYVTPPENVIPGVATYYASTCRECPAACGLHMKTREGRVIKLEGNPNHPVNQGTLCVRGQSAVQGLYNADRTKGPMARQADGSFKEISWDDAQKLLVEKLTGRTGAVQFWTGQETGTRERLYEAFVTALGNAQRIVHEPFAWEALREGNRLSFGRADIPTYDFEVATTVFTFGADFLETWLSPAENSRRFARSHGGDASRGRMVAFEPRLSMTGSNADEWVAIKPGTEALAALAMAQVIVAEGLAKGPAGGVDLSKYTPEAVAGQVGMEAEDLKRLAREFAAYGPSLAVAGGIGAQGPRATQAVVAANVLTSVAGGLGSTIHFGRTLTLGRTNSAREVAGAVENMNAGGVGVLLVHGTDPAHSLPAALGFAEAAKKVPFKVSFSSYGDDTAQLCDLLLPDTHPLESWGDSEAWSGVRALLQPGMRPIPLFKSQSTPDVLLKGAQAMGRGQGMLASSTWLDALKGAWTNAGKSWDDALRDGGAFATPAKVAPAALAGGVGAGALDFAPPAVEAGTDDLTLVVYPSMNLYDGRGANRPWLQELPDPMTKVVWDTWVELHPDTARKLGLKRGDRVTLTTAAGKIEVPVYDYPGIRPDVMAVPTGNGHKAYGRYAKDCGANALHVLPASYDEASGGLAYASVRGALAKTGTKRVFAWMGGDPYTGGQANQMGRGIARTIALTELKGEAPGSHQGGGHGTPGATNGHGGGAHGGEEMHRPGYALSPVPPDPIKQAAKEAPNSAYALHAKHKWAMAIDLNSCNGCQACVLACSAENNVAWVGKEQVERGREMMWIRLERYWEMTDGRIEVRHIPMMCQHCGAAPCESVCPVYATYHNPEGLNAMIYNRCVGTRYCSNNCPYKVRSFNWFDYSFPEPFNWQLNPDVTVRSKGVMEKCTFCVQRIRVAKDHAKDEGRSVRDGEVRTACQQTCPSQAIVFGDVMDPESEISKVVKGARGYHALGDLNTYPSVTYLKKVSRPSPA